MTFLTPSTELLRPRRLHFDVGKHAEYRLELEDLFTKEQTDASAEVG
jgi:hypothetical protein